MRGGKYMYYRPAKAVAADVIPFYEDGEYRLFYLKDYRDVENHGEGCPWHLLTTRNFVDFTDRGEVISRGTETDQDLYVFTGSVFKDNGKYYIFYTGHNPHLRQRGLPEQAVMLAESDDCYHWKKVKDFIFFAPKEYEKHDFRDPFVYKDEKSGQYKMLLAGRLRDGLPDRRGCTLRATSQDLRHWTVEDKLFYSPHAYFTHECPDLFRIGDWWYLVFSEFTDKVCTRYRMSKSPEGPWTTPVVDTFDNRSFYAAKTAGDGDKRYIFGWNPIRYGEKDYAPWQWGGTVVVHEIVQNPDGTLSVKCPDNVKKQYGTAIAVEENAAFGKVTGKGGEYGIGENGVFSAVLLNSMPENCRIEMKFKADTDKDFGLTLRMNGDFTQGYYIKFEPMYNRLCVDRTQRPTGDTQYMVESERYCPLNKGEWHVVTVIAEGSVLEVYVDDKVAMSARMFDYTQGRLGIYSADGKIDTKDIKIYAK